MTTKRTYKFEKYTYEDIVAHVKASSRQTVHAMIKSLPKGSSLRESFVSAKLLIKTDKRDGTPAQVREEVQNSRKCETSELMLSEKYLGSRGVEGFDGYRVSTCGEIWSDKSGRWMSGGIMPSGKGYKQANLLGKSIYFHRAVAKAFVHNPENKPAVNHIDGDTRNNHFTNLEWVTYSENTQHAYSLGLMKIRRKFVESDIEQVWGMYDSGARTADIAKHMGCCNLTISMILSCKIYSDLHTRLPVKAPARHSAETIDKVRELQSTMTTRDIAETLGMQYDAVYKVIRRYCA